MATIPTTPARGHSRLLRGTLVTVALVGVGTLAAACGGGGPNDPGVASVGKTTTTTAGATSSGSGSAGQSYAQELKFTKCMRSHGIASFPDPTASGGFQIMSRNGHGSVNGQSMDVNSPQFSRAQNACQHVLPNDGKPTQAQVQQMLANALKFSHCMRAHGISDFPDPQAHPGGGISISIRVRKGQAGAIDPMSPQFQAAQKACQSLMPGHGHASAKAFAP